MIKYSLCLGLPRHILFYFTTQGTLSAHSWSYMASVAFGRLLPPQHSGVAAHVLWAQVPVRPSWISEWLWGALDFIPIKFRFCITISQNWSRAHSPCSKSTAFRGCGPRPGRACFHLSSVPSLSKAAAPSLSSSALCCSCRLLSQIRGSQLTYQSLSW